MDLTRTVTFDRIDNPSNISNLIGHNFSRGVFASYLNKTKIPRNQEHTSYLLVVPYAISEGHGVVDNVVVGEAGSFRIPGCTLEDDLDYDFKLVIFQIF